MPRNLFGDVVSPSIAVGNRHPYTLSVSILVHAVIVAAAVIVPLRAGGVLPDVASGVVEFIGSVQPVVLPPPPPLRSSASRSTASPAVEPDAVPIAAPPSIGSERIIESPVANVGLVEGNNAGIPGAEALGALLIVPEQPIAAPTPSAPVAVGGRIERPKILRQVAPVYPAAARLARVQGTVIIEATIGVTGKVEDAKVLRSFALLDQAALDAVRQWEFTPTMLNGRATAVVMTVTVDFKLQ